MSMNTNPIISIIMPCLNSARYIEEALDSILGQSFADFELIVVDGGSVDGTLSILNHYAASDARIRILHSHMRSAGAQYNIGLTAARGKFVGFVESDDFITPDMYGVLHKTILGSEIDYVKSNFDMFVDLLDQRLFYSHGPIAEHQSDYYDKILSPQQLCELLRRDIFIWNGLYKRSFIIENNIRFQETPGAAFQDAGFISQVLMTASRAVYIKDSHYRYRKDNKSASSASSNTYTFVMDEFAHIMGVLEKKNDEVRELFLPVLLRRYFGSFHHCLRRYLYRHGATDELIERVEIFRKSFLTHYSALSFPQLSRSDLWPPQDLVLFADDFARYCKDSLTKYESEYSAHMQAAAYLAGCEALVIYGAGENASAVYCYLSRCGLQNIKAFCPAGYGEIKGLFHGLELLPIEQATKAYPAAIFIITSSAGNPNMEKQRLLSVGVALERIIYYGTGLYHHNWHELPVPTV